jgi:hypothetical protein
MATKLPTNPRRRPRTRTCGSTGRWPHHWPWRHAAMAWRGTNRPTPAAGGPTARGSTPPPTRHGSPPPPRTYARPTAAPWPRRGGRVVQHWELQPKWALVGSTHEEPSLSACRVQTLGRWPQPETRLNSCKHIYAFAPLLCSPPISLPLETRTRLPPFHCPGGQPHLPSSLPQRTKRPSSERWARFTL